MRNRIERLRLWLLAGAGVLVLVLAVFIGSARYLLKHAVGRLPAKLGADIKSEMNGFTWSPWDDVKRRTMYTIRAAKEQVHNDGTITLHDVNIVLYGDKGDEAARIYGDDFQYDPKAGLVRAIGVVHIDMKAAEATAGGQKGVQPAEQPGKLVRAHKDGDDDAKILHATTSGLVYMEKLGVAATGDGIEFQLGGMVGHAIGADYNTDSGMLMLHSSVDMIGTAGNRPVKLTATTADLNNREQRAFLTGAKYVSLGETVVADQATLHTRPDGTLERIEAQGNVKSEANGARMVSQRADVSLNEASQPKLAVLTGGVSYALDMPLQQRRGQADAATIAYDAQGRPEHAVFTGSVHLIERVRATEAVKEPWSVRELTAAKVDDDLVAVDARKSELQDAEATGGAHLTVVNNGSLTSTKGEGRSELFADDLKVHLNVSGDPKQRPQLDTLVGRGHTRLHKVTADGIEQTSAGDSLDAKFRPAAAGGVGQVGKEASETLLSALQQGHVTMTRRVPANVVAKKSGKANAVDGVEDATAERAAYDGDLDRMTLTGSVQFTDAGSVVWANQLASDLKTGDAQAEGSVKVNYVKDDSLQSATGHASAPSEPTHILADRADLKHATSVATFYGKPVRLWQGGNQVQAPVIELARTEKRLIARGDAGAQTAQVHTVLVKVESDKSRAGKPGAEKGGAAKPALVKTGAKAGGTSPSVARITSGGLVYSGVSNQAVFTGGVRVESIEGTMIAREATAYLQSSNATPGGATASGDTKAAGPDFSLDGKVERVVATGKIELDQPGSRASGERLVYTASDELYVLTGDANTPPKFVDIVRKTTVEDAAAILFHGADQSVEFLSAAPGEKGTGKRVHTDTVLENDKKPGGEGKVGSKKH
jgi:lipopolysaccharide export system protein LptA